MQGPLKNSSTSDEGGLCIETTADYTEAKSPAFLTEGMILSASDLFSAIDCYSNSVTGDSLR